MGCPFGKKHSMLDTVLPWAQRDFPDRLDVLPGFHAERVLHEGGRALGVLGSHQGETLTIEADEIVLAAGAVGSSWLLLRSGIAGSRAGRELYFNVNSPLTADFPEPVRSYAGLQMSHAYLPDGRRGVGLHPRDLVQPAGDPGAGDAGLVRPPLREHAPLRAHGVRRRAGRHDLAGDGARRARTGRRSPTRPPSRTSRAWSRG